jgi:hypothetical protein
MKYMNKEEWFAKTVGTDTVNEMSTKSGISAATAWRQYNNNLGFTAENVILIARAYKKNPVAALVAFNYIREDEQLEAGNLKSLEGMSDNSLLDELARRLASGAADSNPRWESSITINPGALSDDDKIALAVNKSKQGDMAISASKDPNKSREREGGDGR